jgi:PTS system mannose-specific IIA component
MTTPSSPEIKLAPVGLLLLSHGPLAEALRDTVQILEPEERDEVGALSLAWDEAPEKASRRLEKAIAAANQGRGVVLLTDMFGGTPSNLALAFLEPGSIEIVSGINLPMVIKARALARDGKDAREIAHTLVERGRRAILAAAELVGAGTKG